MINKMVCNIVRLLVLGFAEMTDEDILSALLNTRASSAGTSGSAMAAAFERIAKANGNTVTFDQAKAVNAKYPSDLAYYFRQAGGKIVTAKGRNASSSWTVVKLPNGKLGYPAEVKALADELKAKIAKKAAKPAATPAAQ